MSYGARLKKIERDLNIETKGFDFKRLLEPNFFYNGKAFDDIDEMFKKLKIINVPSILSEDEMWTLLRKRIISVASITKAASEMKQ